MPGARICCTTGFGSGRPPSCRDGYFEAPATSASASRSTADVAEGLRRLSLNPARAALLSGSLAFP